VEVAALTDDLWKGVSTFQAQSQMGGKAERLQQIFPISKPRSSASRCILVMSAVSDAYGGLRQGYRVEPSPQPNPKHFADVQDPPAPATPNGSCGRLAIAAD
jgi:hypothetical protein